MLLLKNITIKNLKNHSFIENFNYSLGNHDKVGIIGEEGNGKSTLLKAIYNKKLLDDYAVISGSIDTDFTHIGYFEQQLNPIWNTSFVYEYLLKTKPHEDIAIERYNELKYLETLFASVALKIELLHEERIIHTLSGGEKVKIQLVKLLAKKMDLLLLDEPTNDLDIETLEWLELFIQNLKIPVIFISHDETLLSRAANVIIHLEQRNKKSKCEYSIFRGNYYEYVEQRGSKLEHEQQIAQKEKREYIKKKIKLNDQMNAVHDALNDTVRDPKMGALLKNKMKNVKAQERRFDKEGFSKVDTVEDAIDVYFENEGLHAGKTILEISIPEFKMFDRIFIQDVDIALYGKDKAVITGCNGCGKSLLLKHLYEELKTRKDINLGYMPQNYMESFLRDETPVNFLLEEGDQKDVSRCRELLGRMKFTSEEMLQTVSELSEGQKAKLYLLRFIKRKCNVLLLDEATRNLSPLSNPIIRRILKEFDGCILAISHDRMFIDEVFNVHYEIKNLKWKKII